MIEEFESARIDTLKKMLTLDDEFALDAQLVGLFERDNIKLNVLYPSLQILAGLAAGYAISHGSKPFFWAFCVLLFASLFFTYRIINKQSKLIDPLIENLKTSLPSTARFLENQMKGRLGAPLVAWLVGLIGFAAGVLYG
jgi:hypothetical protein